MLKYAIFNTLRSTSHLTRWTLQPARILRAHAVVRIVPREAADDLTARGIAPARRIKYGFTLSLVLTQEILTAKISAF